MKRKFAALSSDGRGTAGKQKPSQSSVRTKVLSFLARNQSFGGLLEESIPNDKSNKFAHSKEEEAPSVTSVEASEDRKDDTPSDFILTSFVASNCPDHEDSLFACTSLIAEKLIGILQSYSHSTHEKEKAVRALIGAMRNLHARHQFSRSHFAELLFLRPTSAITLPLYVIWRLNRENIIPFTEFLAALDSSPTRVAHRDSFLHDLKTQAECVSTAANVPSPSPLFEEMVKELVRVAAQSLSTTDTPTPQPSEPNPNVGSSTPPANIAGPCAASLLSLLCEPEFDDVENQIRAARIHAAILGLAKGIRPTRLSVAFFQYQLDTIFRAPASMIQSTFEEAYGRMSTKESADSNTAQLENIRVVIGKIADLFLSFFPASKVFESIQRAITHNEGKWHLVFLFVRKLAATTEGPSLLLHCLKSLVSEALTGLKEHPLKVAILLYRLVSPREQQTAIPTFQEEGYNYPAYSTWFRNSLMAGAESVLPSRKLSQLLLRVLIAVLPFEPAYYTKLHVRMLPRLKKVDNALLQEYINLSRQKLAIQDDTPMEDADDTSPTSGGRLAGYSKETAEAEVKRFVERYAATGKMDNFHSLALLKGPWFSSVFVPMLLTPMPFSQIREDKKKFIAALVAQSETKGSIRKTISPDIVEKWKAECLRLEKEATHQLTPSISTTPMDSSLPQEHKLLALIEQLRALVAQKRSKENDVLMMNILEDIDGEAKRISSEHALFSRDTHSLASPSLTASAGGDEDVLVDAEHQLVENLLNGFVSVFAAEINAHHRGQQRGGAGRPTPPSFGASEYDWMEDYAKLFGISQRLREITSARVKQLLLHHAEALDLHSVHSLGAFLVVFSDVLQPQHHHQHQRTPMATDEEEKSSIAKEIWQELSVNNRRRMLVAAHLALSYIECAGVRQKRKLVLERAPARKNTEDMLADFDKMMDDDGEHEEVGGSRTVVLDITEEEEEKKNPSLKRRRGSNQLPRDKRVVVLPRRLQQLLLWLHLRLERSLPRTKETSALLDSLSKILEKKDFLIGGADGWLPLADWLKLELTVEVQDDILASQQRLQMMRDVIYSRYLPRAGMQSIAETLLSALLDTSATLQESKKGGFVVLLSLLQEILLHLPPSTRLLELFENQLRSQQQQNRRDSLDSMATFFEMVSLLPPSAIFASVPSSTDKEPSWQHVTAFVNSHIDFFRSDFCGEGVLSHILRGLLHAPPSEADHSSNALMDFLDRTPSIAVKSLHYWKTIEKVINSLLGGELSVPPQHRMIVELDNVYRSVELVLSENLPKDAPLLAVVKGRHGIIFAHALLNSALKLLSSPSPPQDEDNEQGKSLFFPTDITERVSLLNSHFKRVVELIAKDRKHSGKQAKGEHSSNAMSLSNHECTAELFLAVLFDAVVFALTTQSRTNPNHRETTLFLEQTAADIWMALPIVALSVFLSPPVSIISPPLTEARESIEATRQLLLEGPKQGGNHASEFAKYPFILFRLLVSPSLYRRYARDENGSSSVPTEISKEERDPFLLVLFENYTAAFSSDVSLRFYQPRSRDFRMNARKLVLAVIRNHCATPIAKKQLCATLAEHNLLNKLQECDPELTANFV